MAFPMAMIFTFICIFCCLLYAGYICLHQRRRKRMMDQPIDTSGPVDRLHRRGADDGIAGDHVNVDITRVVVFDDIRRSRNAGNYPQSVISTLPEFTYATLESGEVEGGRTNTPATVRECVICLGTVKERDSVRVLPNCLHMFHVECIDMWLFSHPNCPVCRSEAEMAPQTPESPLSVPVVR